jgi:diguanylate cyclase (GGDEF)-like protein
VEGNAATHLPPASAGGTLHERDAPDAHEPLPPPFGFTMTVVTGAQAGRVASTDGAAMTIGLAADADLIVDEPGVSPHHARIARAAGGAFYAEDLRSAGGTFLHAEPIGVALLHGGDVLTLGPTLQLRFAMAAPADETLHGVVPESSPRDWLTGAYNRRHLNDYLHAEVAGVRLGSDEVTVLLIDLDGLGAMNERYGRVAGDRVLRAVADRIHGVLRAEDMLARYGGDEFVVVARGLVDVPALAERVRRAVQGLRMTARGREVWTTASVGVASLSELAGGHLGAAALLASAESRMIEARDSGGDRVCGTDSPR